MRPTPLSRFPLVVASIGNPEATYASTRHSIGHEVVNLLTKDFQPFKGSLISKSQNVLFLKSTGFMNRSGPDLGPAWRMIKSQYPSSELLVVYDELDKSVGKYQLRHGKVSSRGHNGLKSLVESLGNDFYRFGVGIGRPDTRGKGDVADYVLSRVPREDWEVIQSTVVPDLLEVIAKLSKSST